jgi:predicted acylesterase/phospholipase RssA/CRP-like cAMP-binding protein
MKPNIDIVDSLRSHPTSAGLDDDLLITIAQYARLLVVRAGDVVHPLGEPISDALFVTAGRLEMVFRGRDESFTATHLAAGTQFGLLALVQEVVLPVEVIAAVDSRLIVISLTDLRTLVSELPLWKRNLVKAVGGTLRDNVFDDKRRRNVQPVSLIHASPATRTVTLDLARRLMRLGESIMILTDQVRDLAAVDGLRVEPLLMNNGELRPVGELRSLIDASNQTSRVIIDLQMQTDLASIKELIQRSRCGYALVKSADQSLARGWVDEICSRTPGEAAELRWVWCLEPDEPVAPSFLHNDLKRVLKLHLPTGGSNRRQVGQGMVRLVHDVRDARIGIALGGGAARGMAHLGVLQVLEDAGIIVDAIAGTSVGAMVGIFHASGFLTPEQIANCFARDLTPTSVEQRLPGGQNVYLVRKYRSGQWDSMLRPYLHDWSLEQLPTSVASVAADLVSGRQIVSRIGDAVQAILDSINLPGIAAPICRNSMALVDGGIVNNVPADILIQQDQCDFVIAVDVGAKFAEQFAGNRPGMKTDQMNAPGIFQTLMRSLDIQQRNLRAVHTRVADFIIEPDVSTVDVGDFQHSVQIAALGKAAAESVLDELMGQLRSLDESLVVRSS